MTASLPPVEPKDPSESKIYTVDWTSALNTDATIETSTWVIQDGLTKVTDSIVTGDKKTSVQVSGGTADTDYTAENTITTSDGETLQRTGIIRVRDL